MFVGSGYHSTNVCLQCWHGLVRLAEPFVTARVVGFIEDEMQHLAVVAIIDRGLLWPPMMGGPESLSTSFPLTGGEGDFSCCLWSTGF